MSITNLNPVFFLLIGVSGNFIAETLGCKTQKFLTNNMFAKQAVVVSLLFFTMTLTERKSVPPHEIFKFALFYWMLFLLATKTTPIVSILLFCLLITMFVVNSYIEHYNETDVPTKDLVAAQKILKIIFLIVLYLGFLLYTRKQYNEKGSSFNVLKLLFGTTTCGK